jgi:hypothetical protein
MFHLPHEVHILVTGFPGLSQEGLSGPKGEAIDPVKWGHTRDLSFEPIDSRPGFFERIDAFL